MDSIPAILSWLNDAPTTARYIAASSKLDALPDSETAGNARIAILSNITLDPIIPSLKVECYRIGLRPIVYVGPFDGAQQVVFDPQSSLFQFEPDIVVLALRLHTLTPDLMMRFGQLSKADVDDLSAGTQDRVIALLGAIRARSPATILVNNFELAHYPSFGILDAQLQRGQQSVIRDLNARLAQQVAEVGGAYVVDLEHVLASVGYDSGLDDRYWHIGRAPYAQPLLKRLSAEYAAFAAILKGRNRKCLVLDCDNTLWGGVVGEDGINGIRLGTTHPGSAYRDFHAAILDLYHRGVLLALNSKNNEADALTVFSEHPGSLLKPEHFVARRINWQDKAANLSEIAAELNIGVDSLVFVDDNPVECEFVRQTLPGVLVVQLPPDPTRYRSTLQSMRCFDTLALSDEDRRRSEMYRIDAQRSEARRRSETLEDYLRSLDMELTFGTADPATIPRIAQLTQKTNQFNVTTRRYSEEDIRRFSDDPETAVHWARLRDRFDDNGLIAVAIVRYEGDCGVIDTLLMSCRVIGRGVERGIIAHVAGEAAAKGCNKMLGEFIPTAKNSLAANLYADQGFEAVDNSVGSLWRLSLVGALPQPPDWFNRRRDKEIV
ncbi:MAG: HAD-IIIC family phosphatase [Capsulimonadaceae bacterium]